jgi:hypothetical protein
MKSARCAYDPADDCLRLRWISSDSIVAPKYKQQRGLKIAADSRVRVRQLSLCNLLRKVFLSIAPGGHSVLGVGMSQEKIEELLHVMHQTRVEVIISDDDETGQNRIEGR